MGRKNKDRYTKAVDDTISIPAKQGNGVLRYSISVDKKGRIARYSFTYINFHLCGIDNGRVIGYDNCHGYHHRHCMGQEEAVDFISYEDIQTHFEKEWRALHEKTKGHKN